MTGLPTAVVKLDDGSGTFPTDISSRVLASEGVTVSSYGRTDEFTQTQASTLTLTLDNADGSLTGVSSGSGFGLGGFGSGPFGGSGSGSTPIAPGSSIRLTLTSGATTDDRFTGRIDGLDLEWPSGGDSNATIQVTAADRLADLGRRTLRSMLEEDILLDNPTAYYTLGEAAGSTSAGDTSGKQAPALQMIGSGAPVVFGNGIGPGTDGLTAAQLTGGQYLGATNTGNIFLPGSAWSIEVWVNIATPPASSMGILQGVAVGGGFGVSLAVNPSGQINGIGPNIADGLTHQIVITQPGSGVGTFYVDSTPVGTAGASSSDQDGLYVGTSALALNFTGTMSHIATYGSVLSAGRVAAHYQMGAGASEAMTARLTRLASYVGATTSTTTGMSGQTITTQSTSGRSAFDAMQELAAAEGGVLYANGSGTIVLQGRNYRTQKTTADLTLGTDIEQIGPDVAITYDTQQVVNKIEITRADGATQVVQDATSITTNGEFSESLDIPFASDTESLAAAQWVVAKHKSPSIRLGAVTLDVLKSSSSAGILARDIGDRLLLSNMPAQMWSGAGDVTIEGWTETLTHTSWDLTLTLLPWSLFQAGIWSDAGSLWDSAVWAQ